MTLDTLSARLRDLRAARGIFNGVVSGLLMLLGGGVALLVISRLVDRFA